MNIIKESRKNNILLDTKNIIVNIRKQKIIIDIKDLITPFYEKYWEKDLCCINEVKRELRYLIKLLFPSFKNKAMDIVLVSGEKSYIGANIILRTVKPVKHVKPVNQVL